MGIEHAYDEKRRLVLATARGTIGPEDMVGHIRRVAADDRVLRPLYEIWDGTGIEKFNVFGADVRGFLDTAISFQERFGAARLAIVAGTPVLYGLGRMAQLLSDATPFEICVFKDLETGEAWMEERLAERDAEEA